MKSLIHCFAFIFFVFSVVADVSASQPPRPLGAERKFRSYVYNPNYAYRYLGHYKYQGFIEFEKGEKISTISMGNPSLWLFESIDNRLFLKPIGEDNSETNMTVITSKRVYHFELFAKEASGINDKDLIFVAKFSYPDEKDKNIVQYPKKLASDKPDLRDLSIYNFNYTYVGDKSITPIRVFDNGEFTYFQFSHKNAEVPAIFSVDSNGFESIVNFRSAGDYIVVERVGAQFTMRNGTEIVCIYNLNLRRDIAKAAKYQMPVVEGSINSLQTNKGRSSMLDNYSVPKDFEVRPDAVLRQSNGDQSKIAPENADIDPTQEMMQNMRMQRR